MAKPAKKDMNDSADPCRIITPEFRVSYPHVRTPNAMKGSKPKYSVTGLFPKNGDLSSLKLAIKHAKLDKFGAKENWPEDIESPVTDGDSNAGVNKKTGEPKDGYAGHWAIKFSSNEENKPGLVDANCEDIIDKSDFYPGCYARAQVFAYVWEFPPDSGRFGVGFILDHVQKTKDGKSFGGKKSAKEAFNPVGAGSDDDGDDNEDGDFT